MIDLGKLEALAELAPEGPWFAAGDDARDAPPHKNSGLALVDTGRQSDWPIARLTEWPTATYIASLDPQTVMALIKAVGAAQALLPAADKSTCDSGRCDALREALSAFQEQP